MAVKAGYAPGVEITGLDELMAGLDAMKDSRARTVIVRAALRKGGRVMQAAIEERTPMRTGPDMSILPGRGRKLPPGALRADIRIRMTSDDSGQPLMEVGPGSATAHVAMWVEYGHDLVRNDASGKVRLKSLGAGMGKKIGDVPAHPFIRPAFEEAVQGSVDAIVASLETQLAKKAQVA